jgi:hypothetical protein
MNTIEEWVWFYYHQGLLPIPLKRTDPPSEDNKKPNLETWKEYQNKFPSEDEIKQWLKEDRYQNIGIICGSISNNLIVFDFDDETLFDDIKANPDKLMESGQWVVKTGKPGRYHVYVRSSENPGNVIKDMKVNLEKRGNGGYIVAPPSVHPNGNKYHFHGINDPSELKPLLTVNAESIWNNLLDKAYNVKSIKRKKPKKISKKGKKRLSGGTPECVKKILMGVPKGQRNDTAFVLTQYYAHWKNLDAEKTKELMQEWNKKNNPMLPNNELNATIESALRSDKKIGCTRFNELGFCPYEDKNQCRFLKEKQKIIYVSTKTFDDTHIEEIIEEGIPRFVVYDKNTDEYTIEDEYENNGIIYKPIYVGHKLKNSIILPDGIEEYATLGQLRKEMIDFALMQYDPVDNNGIYELIITLDLTSWISPIWQEDMAERFIPVINPRGPSETGKKRFLTVQRWLTYHSLYGLKTNRTPTLFRAIDPWQGTLVLDEADMNDSSLSSELVEFINSRCDGVPIPRYGTESKQVEWFYSFGLTVLATRQGFTDDGLESRCMVMPTATTENPEKYELIPPGEWLEKGKQLQRKLLLFKLRHLDGKMPTQLLIPDVKSFRVRESLLILQGLRDEDPTLMKGINEIAKKMEERIIKERAASPEGLILNVIYDFLTDSNVTLEKWQDSYIAIREVRTYNKEEGEHHINRFPLTLRNISKSLGEAFSSSAIAKIWRGFDQDTLSQKRIDEKRIRGVMQFKNLKRLDRVFPKYVFDYQTPAIIEYEIVPEIKQEKIVGDKP